MTVTNSTFTNNTTTGAGGGVIGAGVTVTNSTFINNTARAGGGVASPDGGLTLVYATVVGNTAATGANLAAEELSRFGSVVTGPLGGGANCDISGASPVSGGYNYSDDASCAFTGTGDTENGADPQLLALGDFGGPTQTRPPAVTSPLVDAIPVADCYPGIAIDQRGLRRPADGNLDGTYGCDIGAVELQATPAATPAAPTATGPVAARPAFTG